MVGVALGRCVVSWPPPTIRAWSSNYPWIHCKLLLLIKCKCNCMLTICNMPHWSLVKILVVVMSILSVLAHSCTTCDIYPYSYYRPTYNYDFTHNKIHRMCSRLSVRLWSAQLHFFLYESSLVQNCWMYAWVVYDLLRGEYWPICMWGRQ